MVMRGDIYEEEDFVQHPFGFDFASEAKPDAVAELLQRLKAAEEWVAAAAADNPDMAGLGPDEKNAILARLRLRSAFLQALREFDAPACGGLEGARAQIQIAQAQLEEIRRTAGDEPKDLPQGLAGHVGFDLGVSRRLLGSALPRVIKLHTRAEAWEYIAAMLRHLLVVCDVKPLRRLGPVVTFLEHFSALAPGVVARSRMIGSLLHNGTVAGTVPMSEFLLGSIWQPPPPKPPPPATSDLQDFIDQADAPVKHFIQILCSSRSRQRRRLRHLVPEFSGLCQGADECDGVQAVQGWAAAAGPSWRGTLWSARPLSIWAQRWMLYIMQRHLLMGFDLDLYAPEEYCMIYWYTDAIMGHLSDNLQALDDSLHTALDGDGAAPPQRGGGKRKTSAEAEAALAEVDVDVLMLNVQREMCRGLVRLAAGMDATGRLPKAAKSFNHERERYWQRFGLFYDSSYPQFLLYEHYEKYMDVSHFKPEQLLQYAGECFRNAGVLCARVLQLLPQAVGNARRADLTAQQKVARTNMVAIAMMHKMGMENVRITFDFTTCATFPTVAVRSLGAADGLAAAAAAGSKAAAPSAPAQ